MWAWGIDVSTKRLAFAAVSGWRGEALAEDIDIGPPARVLAAQRATTAAMQFMASEFPCGYVLVEQPSGRNVHPELWYVAGAVIAGVLEGTELAGLRPAVATVPPSTWKAEAGIGGGANKEEIAAWARRLYGWDGKQDEADALGVATCAWRRLEKSGAIATIGSNIDEGDGHT